MSGTPTPIVVTKCLDCPFFHQVNLGGPHKANECNHPEGVFLWEGESEDVPDCPLRTSPALVVLRPEGLQSPPLDGTG